MRGAALACLVGFSLLSRSARAEPQPEQAAPEEAGQAPLLVEVVSCVLAESAVDVTRMLAIARAELAPRVLVRADESDGAPLLRVDACHDERLLLRLLSPLGAEQSVALHDVPPEHRPRVAALALAELLLAARSEVAAPDSSAPSAESSVAGQPTEPAASEPAPPLEAAQRERPSDARSQFPAWAAAKEDAARAPKLGLGMEVRAFLQGLAFSYGPRINLGLRQVEVGLFGLVSRHRSQLGELNTGIVSLSTSYACWRSSGPPDVAVSVGGELGVSWGTAEPFTPSYGRSTRALGQFVAGFAELSVGGTLAPRAYGQAGLMAGYATGVRARIDDETKASTHGAFASLSASVAWIL